MGKREIKHPDKQVDTGAYSAAVEVDGWVYVSGHGPLDMQTGEVIGSDIETQTRVTLEHIQKVLGELARLADDEVSVRALEGASVRALARATAGLTQGSDRALVEDAAGSVWGSAGA